MTDGHPKMDRAKPSAATRILMNSMNKRKLSLRKYIDKLRGCENRLDINQITKYVFLGTLCLKPVPHIFESPLLIGELERTLASEGPTQSNNMSKVAGIISDKCCEEPSSNPAKARGAQKRKSLEIFKAKKFAREMSAAQFESENRVDIKKETVKEECCVEEGKPSDFIQEFGRLPMVTTAETAGNLPALPMDLSLSRKLPTVGMGQEIETCCFNSGVINLPFINNLIVPQQELQIVPCDIRCNEMIAPAAQDLCILKPVEFVADQSDNRSFCEKDLELCEQGQESCEQSSESNDSSDGGLPHIMYNIVNFKMGQHTFEKDIYDTPVLRSENFEEYSNRIVNEYIEKMKAGTTSVTITPIPPTEKKYFKRTPQCKICSKVFSSYVELKKHRMEIHNGVNPYPCPKCGLSHATLDELIAHIRSHKGKPPYECRKCNRGFDSQSALEAHEPVHILRKVLEPKKSLPCEICGKEFRKLCDLERHMRVHTGEKPVVCNICNRRFQQAHNLNKHLLIHTQEKPFQCDICSKKFGRNDVLNRHLLTHLVKKSNDCPDCGKSFIRTSQLMAHALKCHSKSAP